MIEHFDIILVTETVLRIHAQTRQLLSEKRYTRHIFVTETTESAETLMLVNNSRVTKLARIRVG